MRTEIKFALVVGVILLAGGVAWFGRMSGQTESGRDFNQAQKAADEQPAGATPPKSTTPTINTPKTTTRPGATPGSANGADPANRTRPRIDPTPRDIDKKPPGGSPLLPGSSPSTRDAEESRPRANPPIFEPRVVPPRDERPTTTEPPKTEEELTPRGVDPRADNRDNMTPSRPADISSEPRDLRPRLPGDRDTARDVTPPVTPPSNPSVEPRTPMSGLPGTPPQSRPGDSRVLTPPSATARGEREYVVKEEDTYVAIATAEYGDQKYWPAIAAANPGVDPRTLKVGQKLKLPLKPEDPAEARPAATAPPSSSTRVTPAGESATDRVHVIAEGDTLAEIAERYYGEQTYWPALAKANPGVDANRLLVGNKLRLPAKEALTRGEARETPRADARPSNASRVNSTDDMPEYIVEGGDSLIGIARKVLGDGERWNEIFELNKDKLESADDIRVGMKLRVPRPPRSRG